MEGIDTEFVIYPLALRLKLLGYDEPCFGYFDIIYNSITKEYEGVLKFPTDVKHLENTKKMLYLLGQQKILAPTWQSAFKWFRKKYKLHSHFECINSKRGDNFKYTIHFQNDIIKNKNGFNHQEEAEIECLTKLLETVEQNKINNEE